MIFTIFLVFLVSSPFIAFGVIFIKTYLRIIREERAYAQSLGVSYEKYKVRPELWRKW
jgi:protein-S-isoprenylcysteine O-methyltransferase Ste14